MVTECILRNTSGILAATLPVTRSVARLERAGCVFEIREGFIPVAFVSLQQKDSPGEDGENRRVLTRLYTRHHVCAYEWLQRYDAIT